MARLDNEWPLRFSTSQRVHPRTQVSVDFAALWCHPRPSKAYFVSVILHSVVRFRKGIKVSIFAYYIYLHQETRPFVPRKPVDHTSSHPPYYLAERPMLVPDVTTYCQNLTLEQWQSSSEVFVNLEQREDATSLSIGCKPRLPVSQESKICLHCSFRTNAAQLQRKN